MRLHRPVMTRHCIAGFRDKPAPDHRFSPCSPHRQAERVADVFDQRSGTGTQPPAKKQPARSFNLPASDRRLRHFKGVRNRTYLRQFLSRAYLVEDRRKSEPRRCDAGSSKTDTDVHKL
jgi:hypothetical protein